MAHPVAALRQGSAPLEGKGITAVIVNQNTHRRGDGERVSQRVGEDKVAEGIPTEFSFAHPVLTFQYSSDPLEWP